MAVNGKSLNRAGADNGEKRLDSLVFFDEWDPRAGEPVRRWPNLMEGGPKYRR